MFNKGLFAKLHACNIIESILYAIVTEQAATAYTMLTGLKYLISRCFKLGKDNKLILLSANINGSRIATQLHIYRIIVCSTLSKNNVHKWDNIISMATSRPLIHYMCPLLRSLKQIDSLKPKQVQKTIDPFTHDITVGTFTFKKEYYSKLIPSTCEKFVQVFADILSGEKWKEVLDYNNDIRLIMDGNNFQKDISFSIEINDDKDTRSLVTNNDIQLSGYGTEYDYQLLDCLMQLTLHGLGGGPMRFSELATVTLNRVTYCRDSIHFFAHSFKQMNTKVVTRKLVERRLHGSLSRCAILYNLICRKREDIDQPLKLFCVTSDLYLDESTPFVTMPEVFSELMRIESEGLNTRIIRSMYTSIQNTIGIGTAADAFQLRATVPEELALRAGHTKFTHDISYSSDLIGEQLFEMYFRALGGHTYASKSFSEPGQTIEPNVPETLISDCVKKLYGSEVSYLSMEQKNAILHCCSNEINTHAFFTISCGGGKSASWEISTLARLLNRNSHKTQIVTVPYCFLLRSQYLKSKALLSPYGINVSYYTLKDINNENIPEELLLTTEAQHISSLPHLMFLSLEALHSLFTHHGTIIESWKERKLIRCIFIDEVHTIITELNFRTCYSVFQELATLGIPLIALSGTLDKNFFGSLSTFLHFKEKTQSISTSIISIDDGILFSKNIKLSCIVSSNYVLEACNSVDTFLINNSTKKAHVIVATLREGESIYTYLKSKHYVVEFIHSASGNQEDIANRWVTGSIGVLISTTLGIVGNENQENHFVCIVGYLYNCQSIVQSIGRIRPHRRVRNLSKVEIYVDVLNTFELNNMKADSKRMASNMIRHKVIDENSKDYFLFGSTQYAVYEWIHNNSKCRIATLGARVGSLVERNRRCGICDICMAVADDNQLNKMSKIASDFRDKEREIIKETIENLKILKLKCLLCNKRTCKGVCKQQHGKCLKCDGNHQSSVCKKEYMLSLQGKACYSCYEYVFDNNKKHSFKECQVQERLRVLFITDYRKRSSLNKKLSYREYLNEHFSSKTSFCKFVNSNFGKKKDR